MDETDNVTEISEANKRKSRITFEEIEKLAAQGLTDKEIAEKFNVTRHTFGHWKEKKPGLKEALERGRENVIKCNPGGKKVQEIDLDRVREIAAKGFKKHTQIAAKLGVSLAKYNEARNEDDSIDQAIALGHAEFLEPVFQKLQEAAITDGPVPVAAMFIAKVFADWQDTAKVQIDGNLNVNNRVQLVLPKQLEPEAWDNFVAHDLPVSRDRAEKFIEMIETKGTYAPEEVAAKADDEWSVD